LLVEAREEIAEKARVRASMLAKIKDLEQSEAMAQHQNMQMIESARTMVEVGRREMLVITIAEQEAKKAADVAQQELRQLQEAHTKAELSLKSGVNQNEILLRKIKAEEVAYANAAAAKALGEAKIEMEKQIAAAEKVFNAVQV